MHVLHLKLEIYENFTFIYVYRAVVFLDINDADVKARINNAWNRVIGI